MNNDINEQLSKLLSEFNLVAYKLQALSTSFDKLIDTKSSMRSKRAVPVAYPCNVVTEPDDTTHRYGHAFVFKHMKTHVLVPSLFHLFVLIVFCIPVVITCCFFTQFFDVFNMIYVFYYHSIFPNMCILSSAEAFTAVCILVVSTI